VDSLGAYIATIVVSLIVGYLSRYVEPTSKLVHWSPHNFFFDIKDAKVVLQSNSLAVQNIGRRPAEDVEIIHKARPDFFQFSPPVAFEEEANPSGEHVLRIKALGPKEWVFLQLLSYQSVPFLQNVRWKHGQSKVVIVQPFRVWPRPIRILSNVLLVVGAGTLLYWLCRVILLLGAQLSLWHY
jgi:hypothetical protein